MRAAFARHLALAVEDVHGHADRPGLVADAALDGLADPPRGVGRELVALAPVELLDRADEADDPLLDQVEERQAVTLVALGDRDDEAQVGVDHPLLRVVVAALDELCELDLLLRGQERPAARLVEEELEGIRRRQREVAVEVGRGVGIDPGAVVADLDAVPLGVLVERARLVGVDVELLGHTLDLGQIEAAELFAMGDQGREPVMVKRVGHTSPPCL